MIRLLTIACLVAFPLIASAQSVARDRVDPRWVRGEVVAEAPVAELLARLHRVRDWPAVFDDMRSLQVERRRGARLDVRIDSKAATHEIDWALRFTSDGLAMRAEGHGVDLRGRFRFTRGPRPGTTRVRFELFADTRGFLGLFIPESSVRRIQRRVVHDYLRDIARAMGGA